MNTDEALYARLRKGDKDCLAELVRRFHAPLFKYLYRMTGNEQTAEDLVQEAFVRVLIFEGDAPQRFKPWAFTISRNLARDYFRSSAYRQDMSEKIEGVEALMLDGNSPLAEQKAIQKEDRVAVTSALHSLPHEQREVLVLRFFHDLRLEEIADVTGVPLGTVKSRLYHSLKKLKNYLESEERSTYERAK